MTNKQRIDFLNDILNEFNSHKNNYVKRRKEFSHNIEIDENDFSIQKMKYIMHEFKKFLNHKENSDLFESSYGIDQSKRIKYNKGFINDIISFDENLKILIDNLNQYDKL